MSTATEEPHLLRHTRGAAQAVQATERAQPVGGPQQLPDLGLEMRCTTLMPIHRRVHFHIQSLGASGC